MVKLVYKVVRVVREGFFQSVSPARLEIVTKILDVIRVADYLYYEIGKWTEALPNSMGIFVFPKLKYALSWCAFASNEVILECEYRGELKRVWFAVDPEKRYYTKEKWSEFLKHVYNSPRDFIENAFEIKCIWTPTGTYTVEAVKPIRIIEGGNNG